MFKPATSLSPRSASRLHRKAHAARKCGMIHNPEYLQARVQQMVASSMERIMQGDPLNVVLDDFESSLRGCPARLTDPGWTQLAAEIHKLYPATANWKSFAVRSAKAQRKQIQ